ncbi:AAA family ATPase [Dietzia cinnamea]|uniref:AAA family ATPase n=1 Tax=Dietzia cinnamea TaxID=321318 RepID=UPI003CFD77B6
MQGRTTELEWLTEQLEAGGSGPPRLTLVKGPLGSGKTALLFSALAELDRPTLFLRGDPYPDTETPLAAARQLVERLFDQDLERVVADHSPAAIHRQCCRFLEASPDCSSSTTHSGSTPPPCGSSPPSSRTPPTPSWPTGPG